ncbi:arylamine N-acetyltransferase [Pseudoflavitalea sp. G-6-1-2]|uniref:arylamine N-acetyltransferase family protein n=1 Tax=Pseudoflavitalea sp. G-6-1-2 TaxID=2728841 RepID=UPI00146D76BC|nr:arylamine N-acetyltransferase [Pseudoflavitalea sp. G-6-1-2]NML22854.1 arylamine N-acetyltransferase [Pseudoflavitalea sp. G-6-1-2]
MNVPAYLRRIGYQGSLVPTLETLAALQRAHLLAVPFENLDIHMNIPIYIDPDAIYRKVVERRRGGFCYELNSLFRQLLETIGYDTILVSAKVYSFDRGSFGPEFDHMAIIVEVGKEIYLVDVGFGEFAFSPLVLDFQIDQEDERGVYRMRTHEFEYLLISRMDGYSEKPLYVFTIIPRRLKEFEGMCKYHQTSPGSSFTRKRMISLPTLNGRKTLSGNRFKITHGKGEIEVDMETEEDVKGLLKREFGVEI